MCQTWTLKPLQHCQSTLYNILNQSIMLQIPVRNCTYLNENTLSCNKVLQRLRHLSYWCNGYFLSQLIFLIEKNVSVMFTKPLETKEGSNMFSKQYLMRTPFYMLKYFLPPNILHLLYFHYWLQLYHPSLAAPFSFSGQKPTPLSKTIMVTIIVQKYFS